MPFWHLRTITGIGIISGALLQIYNMWMTARTPAASPTPLTEEPAVSAV
jgi:cbb3-type cytochrome oxidase subunit 1